MENRVVGIRKFVNRDKWRNIGRASNPADMPTRVCDMKDFDSWFRGPAFLFQIKFKFEGCDATERLELMDNIVNIETKGMNSGKEKEKSSLTSCVITQVMTAMSIEHVNFSKINKQTLNKNSCENTMNNILGITKYSSLNKVIVITAYVLRFIKKLKSSVKKESLCKDDILQVKEYNESLKL